MGCASGNRERYAGTEFSDTDLVDKAKIDIVCSRCEDACILLNACMKQWVSRVGERINYGMVVWQYDGFHMLM